MMREEITLNRATAADLHDILSAAQTYAEFTEAMCLKQKDKDKARKYVLKCRTLRNFIIKQFALLEMEREPK
jgi:hypothetical protein